VDGQVQAHELNKVLVLAKSKLVGKVERVILVLLDWDVLAILEYILVDAGGNGWELCNEVHRVLESVSPVVLLVDTSRVCLGERRFVLESGDSNRELSHWVEIAGAAINELLDELWNV
jgi:hypothetical protein